MSDMKGMIRRFLWVCYVIWAALAVYAAIPPLDSWCSMASNSALEVDPSQVHSIEVDHDSFKPDFVPPPLSSHEGPVNQVAGGDIFDQLASQHDGTPASKELRVAKSEPLPDDRAPVPESPIVRFWRVYHAWKTLVLLLAPLAIWRVLYFIGTGRVF